MCSGSSRVNSHPRRSRRWCRKCIPRGGGRRRRRERPHFNPVLPVAVGRWRRGSLVASSGCCHGPNHRRNGGVPRLGPPGGGREPPDRRIRCGAAAVAAAVSTAAGVGHRGLDDTGVSHSRTPQREHTTTDTNKGVKQGGDEKTGKQHRKTAASSSGSRVLVPPVAATAESRPRSSARDAWLQAFPLKIRVFCPVLL